MGGLFIKVWENNIISLKKEVFTIYELLCLNLGMYYTKSDYCSNLLNHFCIYKSAN